MPYVVEVLHSTLNGINSIFNFTKIQLLFLKSSNYCKNLPVNGYQAAPLVMPLGNDGVPALQASPRLMVGWFCAYVRAKCLKTSSSGVSEGAEVKL